MKIHGMCDACRKVILKNGDLVLRVAGPWSKSYYNTQYCEKCISKVETNPKLEYEKVNLTEKDKINVNLFSLFWNHFSLKSKYPEVVKRSLDKGSDENIVYFLEEAPHEMLMYLMKIKYLTPECLLQCKNFVT